MRGGTTMRALCGAIITAGALLGLGLTAIGFGTRYAGTTVFNTDTKHFESANLEHWWKMERTLLCGSVELLNIVSK